MRELLRSHSLSYVQGLQVALEAQGIETTLFDQQSLGFMGFAGQVRLMVTHDAEYEAAMRIVRELQQTTPVRQYPSAWKVQRWGCAGLVLGFGVMVEGASLLGDGRPGLGYSLLGGAMAFFLIGLALILFAPRRERSKPQ